MRGKDDRTAAEKRAWKAGEFTEAEARKMGMTRKQANEMRARTEWELGNPLAPPPAWRRPSEGHGPMKRLLPPIVDALTLLAQVVANAWYRALDWADDRRDDLRWRCRLAWWSIRTTGHRAVTGALRLVDPTIEHRNSDKAHRCPGCHAIECDQPKRFYRLYRCLHCGARHWPGWRWQRSADTCELPVRGWVRHVGARPRTAWTEAELTPPPDKG